jgi:mono/diheme cytochrome c family protein
MAMKEGNRVQRTAGIGFACVRNRPLPCRRFAVCYSLFALFFLAGCDLPGKPNPDNEFVYPSKVSDFTKLYELNCAGCHGKTGQLGPAPPLKDRLFLAIVPDEELYRVIAEGRRGTPMPAFAKNKGGTLTDEQVKVLASTLKSGWGTERVDTSNVPPYSAPAAEAKPSKGAGQRIFARSCAGCHGSKGEGGPHAGAINDPAFLALISDQALRRIIITGRPDLGMPDYAQPEGREPGFKPLSSEEIEELVFLLASWRRPAGKE